MKVKARQGGKTKSKKFDSCFYSEGIRVTHLYTCNLTDNNQLLSALLSNIFSCEALIDRSVLFPCLIFWSSSCPDPPGHLSQFPANLHQAGIPALLSHPSLLPSQLRASTNIQYLRNADALPRRHAPSKNRHIGETPECVSSRCLHRVGPVKSAR